MSYYKPSKFIDFHAHIYPDNIAPKAMEMFRRVNRFETHGDGTAAGTLKIMDEMGIDICVSQPVATSPAYVKSINDWSVSIRSDRLVPYGAMHPEFAEFDEEMGRMLDLGFTGFKLQPGWQFFYPDEERVFPIYEAAEKKKLAILFHAGDELNTALEAKGHVPGLRKVHDKFPSLAVILAHMGGYRRWEEVEQLLLGKDLYFDSSYCPEDELSDDEMVRLIRKQGANNILFGTDFPLRSPLEDAERLARLDLTPEEKDLVAWGNAERVLGL